MYDAGMTASPTHTMAFAHLVNVAAVSVPLPCEVIPGHRLVRASDAQATLLRDHLLRHRYLPWGEPHELPIAPYEVDRIDDSLTPLTRDRWKYFVIECEGYNTGLNALERAEDILAARVFEMGFVFSVSPTITSSGFGIRPLPEQFPWERSALELTVTESHIADLRRVHELLTAHDHGLLDLRNVQRELYELRMVDSRARIRFLAYFSVLESLLTHKPKADDRYDSITRQIKKKLRLIAHRSSLGESYTTYFGRPPEAEAPWHEKLWGWMYEYRSLMAHGDSLPVTRGGTEAITGPLAALKSHQNALGFLVRTVSTVIQFGLAEPQLLRDLHEC